MRYIRNYITRCRCVFRVNIPQGAWQKVIDGNSFVPPSNIGWIACIKNKEKGYFDTREEAEMALLEMMLA